MSVEAVAQRYPGLDIRAIMNHLKPIAGEDRCYCGANRLEGQCELEQRCLRERLGDGSWRTVAQRLQRMSEEEIGQRYPGLDFKEIARRYPDDRRHTEPHYKLDPQKPLDETDLCTVRPQYELGEDSEEAPLAVRAGKASSGTARRKGSCGSEPV